MTIAGAMLMETREMLAGRDPRSMVDRDWGKFWFQAMLTGGGLGFYGDVIYNAGLHEIVGGDPIYGADRLLVGLSGPTLKSAAELLVSNPGRELYEMAGGKEFHFLAEQGKVLKTFVPGQNVWYAKAALDHLIFGQVFEMLSPGYLRSVRSKAERRGSKWWWSPDDMTPDRPPNLERAVER